MDKKKYILETRNLSIGYSAQVVASDINLSINPGDLVGVIGVNGAGKSTLLRTLSGLQSPLSGEILQHQKDITTQSYHERSRLQSVVLTKQNISQNLTVSELVALGRQPYTNWLGQLTKTDKEAIDQAITQTTIEELKDKKLHALSDGQLQKALIARAVAQEAEIILLDEPLSHLDLHHKSSILKVLKSLSEQGKSILFTTHDIAFALALCTHIVLIQDGKVTQNDVASFEASGVLKSLFPDSHISYDAKHRTFKIVK